MYGTPSQRMPETEAMLTIAPLPCRSMCGSTCLQVRNMLFKFTSLTRSQLSSLVSTGPPISTMPTLLCSTSIRPNAVMQASTIRSDIIGTGHVPGDDLADAALALDDPFGLDGGIEVEVDGKHLCALAAEEHRRCLAVAPTRTARTCSRNQRYLLLEPIAHALLPKQLHREITLGPINGDGGSAVRERDLPSTTSLQRRAFPSSCSPRPRPTSAGEGAHQPVIRPRCSPRCCAGWRPTLYGRGSTRNSCGRFRSRGPVRRSISPRRWPHA